MACERVKKRGERREEREKREKRKRREFVQFCFVANEERSSLFLSLSFFGFFFQRKERQSRRTRSPGTGIFPVFFELTVIKVNHAAVTLRTKALARASVSERGREREREAGKKQTLNFSTRRPPRRQAPLPSRPGSSRRVAAFSCLAFYSERCRTTVP